jgi:hypothetical protein
MNFKHRYFIILGVFAGMCLVINGCNKTTTWKEAQKENTYEAYHAYIKAHPEGEHIAEAQKRAEERYWNSIKNDTLSKGFQKYLDIFPNGTHKLKAKARLNQLSSGGTLSTKAKVTGSSVIIRAGHTTDALSVGVVARAGTIVKILDRYEASNNNEALLKQSITVIHDGKQFKLPEGKAVQVLSNHKDSIHVSFATPNNASVEATISKSAVESMSGQAWYKIHTKDGITGWIYGKFIEEL